jgi:ribosomal protein S12 methylthiotransferase
LRYFLDPFGCVKNQVDAENMMACLDKAGWKSTPAAEEADLIIVNSCGFIESAKQESINAVLEWRKFYPEKKLLLAGCLAQRYSKELSESLPEVDGFFGVNNIEGITEIVSGIFSAEGAKSHLRSGAEEDARTEKHSSAGERPLLSLPGSAYVKISEGCNNNCSFCAIPLIRGALVCRTIPDIVDECRALLKRGIAELCIIGQDIGSWHGENGESLAELLQAISALEGKFWVRLLYIHPDHFPLQILDIIEKDSRLLPYFDIPFQHASDKILAAMNRRGSAAQYLDLIKTIRARLPDAVIRSTFLLGFPGETEEDFTALLDFQQKAALDWLGSFTYSREENTAAFSMKGRVSAKTSEKRKQIIEERQIPITEKNMDRFTGRTLDILIEEQIDGDDDNETFLLGRLYCQAPDIDGSTVILGEKIKAGVLAPCKIIARRGFDLEARL